MGREERSSRRSQRINEGRSTLSSSAGPGAKTEYDADADDAPCYVPDEGEESIAATTAATDPRVMEVAGGSLSSFLSSPSGLKSRFSEVSSSSLPPSSSQQRRQKSASSTSSSSSPPSLSPRKSRVPSAAMVGIQRSSLSMSKSPRNSRMSTSSTAKVAGEGATDDEQNHPTYDDDNDEQQKQVSSKKAGYKTPTSQTNTMTTTTMTTTVTTLAAAATTTPTTYRDLRRMRQKELDSSCSGGSVREDEDGTEAVDIDYNGQYEDEEVALVPGAVAVVPANSTNNNNSRTNGKPPAPYYVSSEEFSVDEPSHWDSSAVFKNSSEFMGGEGEKKGGGSFTSPTFVGSDNNHHLLPRANMVSATAVDKIPIDEEDDIRKEVEASMLSKIAPAELIDGNEIDRRQKRRRIMCVGIVSLVIAIVVGVVVGVVIATGSRGNNDGSSNTAPPSASTTNLDGPLTFSNITATSTTCQNAIPIVLSWSGDIPSGEQRPIMVTGSTSEASFDDEDPDGPFKPCNGMDIGDVTSNGAGVWFRLTGSGEPLALSTCFGCSFDTQISVYKAFTTILQGGSSICSSSMSCVASNDQRTNCGIDGSHFTFLAEAGLDYLIYVHGRRRARGVFTLMVSRLEDNGKCLAATKIEDSNPTGQVAFFGSTKFAAADTEIEECNDVSITSSGAWYVVEAQTSRFLQARVDDFAASVTVFTGPSCDSLACVVGNSEGRAMWTAQAGSLYYIFVHGGGTTKSDFSLTLLPGGLLRLPVGTNDECNLAEELFPPDQSGERVFIEGSTSADKTNWNLTIPACGDFVSSKTMGRWWKVIGNGQGLVASTCETASGFLGQVIVYSGTCDSLQCVDSGDGNCGDQGAVAFFAEDGTTYNILVIGVDDRVGDYVLTLQTLDATTNADCKNPLPLPVDGIPVLGSTQEALPGTIGECQGLVSSAPSSYYWLNGTGGPMMASTCESQTDDFAKIEVFRGNECTAKECINALTNYPCGNQMSVTFQSLLGETYVVQVYGSESTSLDASTVFALSVEGIPENYQCRGASEQLTVGSTLAASTNIFSFADAGDCPDANEEGMWYKVPRVPFDMTLTLSACSTSTNFDAKLTVFGGNHCSQLACIVSNNGQTCGPRSYLSWESSSNQEYYILVQGSGADSIGNFELSLGVENNLCDTAEFVVIGRSVSGTTSEATIDQGKYLKCFKGNTMVEGPSVWYFVVGNGTRLRARTCSGLSSTSTRISIYAGPSCGTLSCLTSVDENVSCDEENVSGVSWFAERNETYYIVVHSSGPTDFILDLQAEINNSCWSSLPVGLIGESEIAVSSQAVSSVEFFDPCTGDSRGGLYDTWYKFTGTGGVVTIDNCDHESGNIDTTFISVFTQSCSDLQCVAFIESNCSLMVDTMFGEDYHLVVGSTAAAVSDKKAVDFSSTNDSCEAAFGPLVVGIEVKGSTLEATPDGFDLCGPVVNRGSGVWFTYIGTGHLVTAFTCSDFTAFDTQITVYRGDNCGALICVDSRDDNCGHASWLTFDGEAGVTYYILVSGKGDSAGRFVMSIQ